MRGLILGLAALVVTSPFAQAAGDSTAGRKVMVKCQSCHGKDGLGKEYLVAQYRRAEVRLSRPLADGLQGRRAQESNDVGVVKSLSDEDIANVAAYYAAIKITVEVPQ